MTLRRHFPAIALTLSLLACGGGRPLPPPPPPLPDAGQVAPADAGVPDCAFSVDPAELTGRQGAHRTLSLTLGADVSAVSLAAAVNASDTVDLAARELRVRLPYDGTVAEWRLRTTCAGEQTVHAVTVEVEPLPWTRAAQWQPGVSGPLAREYFSWWMDEAAPDRLLLFGGFVYQPQQFTPNNELWELALPEGTWTQLQPSGTLPTLTGGRLARDPGTRSALYLGGFTSSYQTPYALHRIAYAPGAEAWTDHTGQTTGGKGDYQPGLLHDPVRQRFLSFCGANAATGYHCDVRQLVNDAWTPVAVAPGPAPQGRNGHAFGYDAVNDRVVLFGGDRQGMTMGDTWTLELAEEPPRWVQLVASSPVAPARRNAAFAIDPLNQRLLVWGGTTTGATAIPGLVALDLVRGEEEWHAVQTTGNPPPRTSGNALFDPARGQMLMGFGNSEAGIYPDLWSLGL